MLWTQKVLIRPRFILRVSVDKKYFTRSLRCIVFLAMRGTHDENTGGNASSIEEIRRKTNDCFQYILLNEPLANLFLRTTPEEYSMRHDCSHDTVLVEHC